jgi:hypothetical protein
LATNEGNIYSEFSASLVKRLAAFSLIQQQNNQTTKSPIEKDRIFKTVQKSANFKIKGQNQATLFFILNILRRVDMFLQNKLTA